MATAKKTAGTTAKAPRSPPTPQWTPAPAPPAAQPLPPMQPTPAGQSGMLKAGTVLLLVGAILHTVAAFFLILFSVFMIAIGGAFAEEEGAFVPAMIGIVYLVIGVVLALGSYFGFSAWRKAQRNELHGAWIHGLVSALLPPVQVITLLGAIFLLVCPEHDAQEKAKQAWGPPGHGLPPR